MQAGARMHDELYGHLLAALRLGAAEDGCRAAVCIAFEPAQPERALHPRTASFPMYRVHATPCMAAPARCLAAASHQRLM